MTFYLYFFFSQFSHSFVFNPHSLFGSKSENYFTRKIGLKKRRKKNLGCNTSLAVYAKFCDTHLVIAQHSMQEVRKNCTVHRHTWEGRHFFFFFIDVPFSNCTCGKCLTHQRWENLCWISKAGIFRARVSFIFSFLFLVQVNKNQCQLKKKKKKKKAHREGEKLREKCSHQYT